MIPCSILLYFAYFLLSNDLSYGNAQAVSFMLLKQGSFYATTLLMVGLIFGINLISIVIKREFFRSKADELMF